MAYQPVIEDHYLDVVRYRNRAPMWKPLIIVVHIQDGTNWGSWDWWHHVTASSTVMISRKGVIWRVVPEEYGPWTNGDVQNPSAEMVAVMNKYGWDPNAYTLSIELEGYAHTPNPMGWDVGFTPEQWEATKWQITQWQNKYDIPDNMVFMHSMINSVTRANCIPKFMWNQVSSFVHGTDVPATSEYAKTFPLPNFDGSKDVVINGAKFFGDRRVATVKNGPANFRQFATRSSALTREAKPDGFSFTVLGWVEGENVNGERRWWVADDYSRVWVGATEEKPRQDPEGKPDYVPRGPVIFDGKVYYRVADFNDFWEDGAKVKVTVSKANLREEANLSSSVLGVVMNGQELNAKYFTIGETVRGENLWWVLHDRRGSIEFGPRLWVGATNLRPR